jgi:hypothetical protein
MDPRETRPFLCRFIDAAQGGPREAWRAAMSCRIVSFNEGRASNGPNKLKMEDAEDD